MLQGNHEYIAGDVDAWFRALEALDVNVLHNSHMKITADPSKPGEYLCLAGTDDIDASERFR